MSDLPPPTEQDLQDVAALADGSLDPARRPAVEARVQASAELTEELARQRRTLELVVAAQRTVAAPAALRALVGAERVRRRPLFGPRRLGLAAGGFAVVAAALIAAFLVFPDDVSGDSLIAQATAAHAKPVERAAPQEQAGAPTLLDFERHGVVFPAWRTTFAWDAVGERDDTAEGRQIATVLYRKAERSIGYSVISGDRIEPPTNARRVERDGTDVRVLTQGDRVVVVFERQGRTCVMSGVGVAEATMVELAAWKGRGTVSFG
jgi:hypothetical protein